MFMCHSAACRHDNSYFFIICLLTLTYINKWISEIQISWVGQSTNMIAACKPLQNSVCSKYFWTIFREWSWPIICKPAKSRSRMIVKSKPWKQFTSHHHQHRRRSMLNTFERDSQSESENASWSEERAGSCNPRLLRRSLHQRNPPESSQDRSSHSYA